MRRLIRAMVALSTVCTVLLLPSAAHAAPAPGAPGAGDSYFPDYGNGGYDVDHYDIALRYRPDTDELTGTTTILAHATQDLSSFNLDFVLDVASVQVNNRAAGFTRTGDHELVVTPARPVLAGAPMTVVVRYSGIPSQVTVGDFTPWVRTATGALAVGQPEIAAWWFPSNDHPTDKATYDVSVIAPDGVAVLSNGLLRRSGPVLVGWTKWQWRTTQPMVTYLAFLAIGQFEVRTDTAADGSPIVTAYGADLGALRPAAEASIERTNEIVDWAAGYFGPYPFEARGGVAVGSRTVGFALENQGRPVYDGAFFLRGANTYVVAHELAHQWFGDSVAVADWSQIWLNEGFATYAEWMWSANLGEGTEQEVFDFMYSEVYSGDGSFWQVLPGDPGPDAIFDDAVYDRGAMALHQLRLAVGDEAFFTILRRWTAEHHFGTGTIPQFQALAEEVAGVSLGELFTTWLFTPGRPELGVDQPTVRALAAGGGKVAEPRSWAAIQHVRAVGERH